MAKSELTKLQKTCDALMQKVGKLRSPKSLVSGYPTDVMHHWVPKSVSSILRYDWDNLIPLTDGEHCRLHRSDDPDINNRIISAKGGIDWSVKLRAKGRQYHKVNKAMYEAVKLRLENELQELTVK